MFNIISHQENPNKNFYRTSSNHRETVIKETVRGTADGCAERGALIHYWREGKQAQPLHQLVQRIPETGEAIKQVKVFTMLDNMALLLTEPTWWKERTNSFKLSPDLMCIVAHSPPPHTHTKINNFLH